VGTTTYRECRSVCGDVVEAVCNQRRILVVLLWPGVIQFNISGNLSLILLLHRLGSPAAATSCVCVCVCVCVCAGVVDIWTHSNRCKLRTCNFIPMKSVGNNKCVAVNKNEFHKHTVFMRPFCT